MQTSTPYCLHLHYNQNLPRLQLIPCRFVVGAIAIEISLTTIWGNVRKVFWPVGSMYLSFLVNLLCCVSSIGSFCKAGESKVRESCCGYVQNEADEETECQHWMVVLEREWTKQKIDHLLEILPEVLILEKFSWNKESKSRTSIWSTKNRAEVTIMFEVK